MSRVQLAINVPDLDEAIRFYSGLFGVQPHKLRDGYANFVVAEPPLKLVLMENDRAERLNHLGVEVESTADVARDARRLAAAGMATEREDDVVCCHARQDKVWVRDPADLRWEIYTVTDEMAEPAPARAAPRGCCIAGDASVAASR